MAWVLLILAGCFEVGFTTCLAKAKYASGSAYIVWISGFFVFLSLSMLLLYKATQTLQIGTAYAVWTGIGAVGTALIGIVFFKEPATIWRIFFISTLIGSIIGLKYVTSH
jgi:quaternary ammonium compound-resistance protein SugE